MIHEWPEGTSNPVSNQEPRGVVALVAVARSADRFINAYWKQADR